MLCSTIFEAQSDVINIFVAILTQSTDIKWQQFEFGCRPRRYKLKKETKSYLLGSQEGKFFNNIAYWTNKPKPFLAHSNIDNYLPLIGLTKCVLIIFVYCLVFYVDVNV